MNANTADEDRFRQTGWPGLRARLFHTYFLIRRPMTLGVRALIHDRTTGKIFLIRHTYVPGWQLPGGGVEVDETMEQAAERECAEEGNVAFTARPVLRSIHHNKRSSRRDHVGFYLVEDFVQPTPKLPDHEIAEAGFFARDALPDDTTPATLRRIAEVFEGAAPSPHW